MGSRPPDEETLVARAKRGETTAYEELVRMHQAIAFRVALVAAGDRGDAEEAAQDAFVKAYRALGRFREGAPFRPWLLRIVANEARNRRRLGRSAGRTGAPRGGGGLGGRGSVPRGDRALTLERRDALLAASRRSTSATGRCSSTASSSSSARRRRRPRSASVAAR